MSQHYPKLQVLWLIPLIIMGLAGCRQLSGEGPMLIFHKQLDSVPNVVIDMPVAVSIMESDSSAISINAQQNVYQNIKIDSKNDTLKISAARGIIFSPKTQIAITLKTPKIKSLINNGSGRITFQNHFKVKHLRLTLNGSGTIEMAGIWAEKLVGKLNGSGNILIKGGFVELARLNLNGSGNINIPNLDVDIADIKIVGSGSIHLKSPRTLQKEVLGSGQVTVQ